MLHSTMRAAHGLFAVCSCEKTGGEPQDAQGARESEWQRVAGQTCHLVALSTSGETKRCRKQCRMGYAPAATIWLRSMISHMRT